MQPVCVSTANFDVLDSETRLLAHRLPLARHIHASGKPIRMPSAWTMGSMAVFGGFIYSYQNSSQRLMGLVPNDKEVQGAISKYETYKSKKN